MQLLCSRALPAPEFVSLSLLLKGEISDGAFMQMRDTLLLPSPLSTISRATAIEAVQELHRYLVAIQKATRSTTHEDSLAHALLKEDEQLLTETQVFRPTKGHGIGLHYKLVRDRAAISPLAQLTVRSASKPSDIQAHIKGIEKEVVGVIFCVGITGLPSAFVMSSVHYSLSQRMNDCLNIISKSGIDDGDSCSTLLTTMLLTEIESRLTNSMSSAHEYHLFGEADDGRGGLLNTKKKPVGMDLDIGFENPLSTNSADQARLMVERLAVLSVVENGTIFSKYKGKSIEKATKSRRRKAGRDADLDGFDFHAEITSAAESISSSASVSDTSSVRSGASRLLKQPAKDTARVLTTGVKPRQASVPALMASNKDTGAKSRRQGNVDQTGRSRPASRKPAPEPFQSQWAGDTVQNNGNNFDPFSTPFSDITSMTSDTSSTRPGINAFDNKDMSMDAGFGSDAFGVSSGPGRSKKRPQESHGTPGGESGTRLLVNVALNEDLTCFYKLSKISSCSVEGVVQVQVKTNADEAPPFLLIIRDPSSHIMSIQENKKFAADVSRGDHYMFKVNVPKDDSYFPVMRYKCDEALRPVPIVSTSSFLSMECIS